MTNLPTALKMIAFVCATVLMLPFEATSQTDWSTFENQNFVEDVNRAVKQIETSIASGPYKPDWESLRKYEIPDWYKDAKLGIFIHWGVYCVPAKGNEWYPRNMYINKKDWARQYVQTPS